MALLFVASTWHVLRRGQSNQSLAGLSIWPARWGYTCTLGNGCRARRVASIE
jgi:hypothetical protein